MLEKRRGDRMTSEDMAVARMGMINIEVMMREQTGYEKNENNERSEK